MQHIVACEREEGQVDEVGVNGHRQQQHGQLQQRVQTQEHGTGHHGDHTAQHKHLRRQREVSFSRKCNKNMLVVTYIVVICCLYLGVSADGEWT